MRTRALSVPDPISGTQIILHRIHEGDESVYTTNPATTMTKSIMYDDPTGNRFRTKFCCHASYAAITGAQDDWSRTDVSQLPNPNAYVSNYAPWGWNEGLCILPDDFHPEGVYHNVDTYIPVSGLTSNDEDDCVFKAYNQFITGVRALDAAVTICEAGETPHLFRLWQRRKGLPSNLVNGFLNYSFGWKPVISDLTAVCRELRSFPVTVRKRLKRIGDKQVRRSFRFDLSATVNDLNGNIGYHSGEAQLWRNYSQPYHTSNKSRKFVVTIRATVKPKIRGSGQADLNRLAALGLVPSLATLWSVMRLSFVIDWFYNIGGAIENLQGSLTHDISNVDVCVTELRSRTIVIMGPNKASVSDQQMASVTQRTFTRKSVSVPLTPVLTLPRRPVQFVLLGLLAVVNTKSGKLILAYADNMSKLGAAKLLKVNRALNAKNPLTKALRKLAAVPLVKASRSPIRVDPYR